MEVQIKKSIRAGNSSAVILPKSWLNKEVRAELIKKTPEMILSDTISIINKYIESKDIIGIYLVGSYARREEDEDSDIDVLVITNNTDNTDKPIIHEGIYNILIVSSKLLKQKLDRDLLPIGQMIREAKPLLNFIYLDAIEVRVTKKNIQWYLDTTEEKLDILKKILERAKKYNKKSLSDSVAYTIILRIRTLEIIGKLILNEDYSKKEFIKKIMKISDGRNAYDRYLAVKNNLKEENGIKLEEAESLYEFLKGQLSELKELIRKC